MTDPEILAERIGHERELREAEARALQLAVDLQSEEIARRLHELNEAYKRAAEDRSQFLTRTVYEVQHASLEKRIATCERMLWIAVGGIMLIEFVSRFIK